MTVVVNDKPISLPTGSRTFGRANIPDGINYALFTLRHCTTATPAFWPDPNTVLRLVARQSNDGGATWMQRSSTLANGGIHVVKGVENPEMTWGFPLVPGVNREVEINVEVENGPLDTRFDLVVV